MERPDTSRFLDSTLGIFLLALVVRLWHVLEILPAPFFAIKMADARSYDLWARALAAGDWFGSDVFYQAPLYPYFLGTVYATVGDGALAVRIVQSLVGSLACVFLVLATRRLFDRRAGTLAGLLIVLYAPAIFFDGLIQKSVLDLFFVSLLLWLLARAVSRDTPLDWLACGAALGGLALTRENAMVLVLPAAAWLVAAYRDRPKRALILGACFVSGALVVLLPVATRNLVVGGEFHLTTSQLGPNFYIGNHPGAPGTYEPLRYGRQDPQFERLDATELAQEALGRELTPSEVSGYWLGEAFAFIRESPGEWLALMGKKFFLTWNVIEQVDSEDLYTHADWSLPLRLTGYVLHFGTLVPLAALGFWLTRTRWKELWLFYGLIAIYAASVTGFYVFARYRYPLVPLLVPFAGAALGALPRFWKESAARARVQALIVVAAVALFCNWPSGSRSLMRAVTRTNVGFALTQQGRLDEAEAVYREALDIEPGYAEAHNSLGTVLQRQGRLDEAIAEYRNAIESETTFYKAYGNLGSAMQLKGQLGEAIRQQRKALELKPDFAEAHNGLATALQQAGRLDEAIEHYRQALSLEPEDLDVHRNVGMALAQTGDLEGALTHFRAVLDARPDSGRVHFFMARALTTLGRHGEAVHHFREAVRIESRPEDYNGLGKALLESGERDAAIRWLEEGLSRWPDHPGLRRNFDSTKKASVP